MHDPVPQAARATAQRLTPTHGPRLAADIEAALYTRDTTHITHTPPDQYTDPVALAALILQAAELAWTFYQDRRTKDTTPPTPDVVTRHVRTTLRETRTLDDGAERVIEITVEETLRALPPGE